MERSERKRGERDGERRRKEGEVRGRMCERERKAQGAESE